MRYFIIIPPAAYNAVKVALCFVPLWYNSHRSDYYTGYFIIIPPAAYNAVKVAFYFVPLWYNRRKNDSLDFSMDTWGNVMKPILYTGAMDAETLYLMQELKQPERVTLGCWKCMRGILDDIPVVIVRTNQGMANAAAATALAIERFEPQAILNQGTSGGHAPDLHRGDIVLGARVINMTAVRTPDRERGAGMDLEHAEPLGLEIANTNSGDGKKMTVFLADAALLSAAEQIKYAEGRVVTGTIGSGDIWNNELDRIHWLHTNWGTLTEEMETAACAQICTAYGIPFLGIRILSNTAVHREAFDETTGMHCQKFARAVIAEYCKRIDIK